MRKLNSTGCFIVFLFCFMVSFSYAQTESELRLNQIQVIASHNSYKKRPDERLLKFLLKFRKQLGKGNNPEWIDYGHLPFDSQFSYYPVRGLEIDIYNDPKGKVFYRRKISSFVHGMKVKSGIEELKQPGFKVLHIKDVDFETNYYTFKQALTALKKWSDAHPNHLPLFINIETKGDGPGDHSGFLRFVGFKRSVKYDLAACDSIDAEIKSVFGEDLKNILTPDRVRGNFSSLDEMATHNGWLLLSEARGKIIFIMEGQAEDMYPQNHPSLKDRVMFVYREPGTPECAFVVMNNSTGRKKDIQELVKKGYCVRSRADGETRQARDNDYTKMNAAFESGAQIVSTDYYQPDLRFSTYQVKFPNGETGRKNPVNTSGGELKE